VIISGTVFYIDIISADQNNFPSLNVGFWEANI
jgi:hypothetical protein